MENGSQTGSKSHRKNVPIILQNPDSAPDAALDAEAAPDAPPDTSPDASRAETGSKKGAQNEHNIIQKSMRKAAPVFSRII